MDIALWIIAGLLAAAFVAAGSLKLVKSKDQLRDAGMAWVDDFGDSTIKGIAGLEILGAIGLVLPAAVGVAEILTPLAATGLVLVMVGAIATHLRRKEHSMLVPPLVLGVLAAVVAWGRFGP